MEYFEKWEAKDVVHPNQEISGAKGWLRFKYQRTHPSRRIVCELAQVGDSALDVGAGNCVDYEMYRERGINYVGIDITPKFIRSAKQDYGVPNVVLGNALHLPFKSNSFPTVYCKDLLEHMPPGLYRNVLREMIRVAYNQVIVIFFHPPWYRSTQYKKGWKGFWSNTYNENEILKFMNGLNIELFKIIRGIVNPIDKQRQPPHTIYVFRK
ncbi:hypothetical protein ES707_03391 [subsurface metagenome]